MGSPAAGPEASDPPRILLVEDDPDMAELVASALGDYYGRPCVDHVTSLASLRGADLSALDLVLCDHNLPDGVSFDAVEHVLSQRDDLPLIVITGERGAAVAAEAIRCGAADYVVKSSDFLRLIPVVVAKNLEAARIRRDNVRLHAALSSSLAELKRKNKQLAEAAGRYEALASTDALTGLANRRRLEERMGPMYAEAARYEHGLACLMIDLDGFKSVNDTLGHRAGDQLLELAGRTIGEHIRTSDLAARYGGDEFVVLLPHATSETAASLAERLIRLFETRASSITGDRSRCTMSVGVSCTASSGPESAWQLIAFADRALYRAKQAERGSIMISGPGGDASGTQAA